MRHTRSLVGRKLPPTSYSQPSTLAPLSQVSSSWTVRPLSFKNCTAFQKRVSTSCLSTPKTCRLSTYCMCQNPPVGAATKSCNRSFLPKPDRSTIRSCTCWQCNAHYHPIGRTAIRGYTTCLLPTATPPMWSSPSFPAATPFSPKYFRSSTGIERV